MKPNTTHRERNRSPLTLVGLAVGVVCAVVVVLGFGKVAEAGSKIVFHSNRDGNSEIYVMSADGTNQTRLTNNAVTDNAAKWSPDGTKILFKSFRNGKYELYAMNADGTDQIRLTNSANSEGAPSWSPDGSQIAFTANPDGNTEIYVMNADGTNPMNITNNAAADYFPSWSPDGTQISFYSNRDLFYQIYVMNADGTNQTNISNNDSYDILPSWSPDGTQIAFESWRDGNEEIYVMNADGTDQTNITNHSAFDSHPTWSPNGSAIAFRSSRDGNYKIFVMNADGSDPTRLTNNSASDASPSWSPELPDISTMIHYYPFSGGPEDAAGAANGTLVGGASVVAGELLLDGVDDYVQLGEHIVPTSGSYTVALFARQPIPQAGHRELISQGFSNGPGFYIGHNPLGVIRVSDNWLNTGVDYPSDGLRHHFAVAVDSTVGSTTLYVDGILQASVGFAIATTPAGTDTRFGQQFDYDEYFAGSLDEIRIYDRTLSALEIASISESDQDNDGLLDVFETNTGVYVDPTDTGTDPLNPDTDADGAIDDSDAFPLDPTETLDTDGDGTGNNADADDDGDGLTDTFEASIGTNPLLVDTDFDTLFDGVELAGGTDPLLADTDGDNTNDAMDNCPLTPNENQSDWDEDGLGNVCDPDPAPEPGELPLLLSGILLLSMMMARRRRVA